MNKIIYFLLSLFIIIIYYERIKINCIYQTREIIKKYPIWPLFKFYDKSNINNIDLLSLLHPTNKLPIVSNYDEIPNILFQTYYKKSKIPTYILEGIKKYTYNYEYILYDDYDALIFLEQYFDKKVVNRFKELKLGAHKADLLRYCFLYIKGGIYLDIKTILIKPLDKIFINKTYFYTCIIDFKTVIYNGIIGTKPRNILLLSLIWYICDIPLYIINEPTKIVGYLSFCLDFYKKIQKDLNSNDILIEGLNIGNSQSYYLFQERSMLTLNNSCKKLDRYGGCNEIYDKNEKIFIGRDPNFPW